MVYKKSRSAPPAFGDPVQVGARIKEIREALGESGEVFAEKVGGEQRRIAYYEKGQRFQTLVEQVRLLLAIAERDPLRRGLPWLLCGTEFPQGSPLLPDSEETEPQDVATEYENQAQAEEDFLRSFSAYEKVGAMGEAIHTVLTAHSEAKAFHGRFEYALNKIKLIVVKEEKIVNRLITTLQSPPPNDQEK